MSLSPSSHPSLKSIVCRDFELLNSYFSTQSWLLRHSLTHHNFHFSALKSITATEHKIAEAWLVSALNVSAGDWINTMTEAATSLLSLYPRCLSATLSWKPSINVLWNNTVSAMLGDRCIKQTLWSIGSMSLWCSCRFAALPWMKENTSLDQSKNEIVFNLSWN